MPSLAGETCQCRAHSSSHNLQIHHTKETRARGRGSGFTPSQAGGQHPSSHAQHTHAGRPPISTLTLSAPLSMCVSRITPCWQPWRTTGYSCTLQVQGGMVYPVSAQSAWPNDHMHIKLPGFVEQFCVHNNRYSSTIEEPVVNQPN